MYIYIWIVVYVLLVVSLFAILLLSSAFSCSGAPCAPDRWAAEGGSCGMGGQAGRSAGVGVGCVDAWPRGRSGLLLSLPGCF